MSSKKKHIILILVLIALISFRYMTVRNHRAEKSRITIVLPQNTQEDLSSVQERIRDYAYDHQIKLDVWYKKQMSEKSFAELVKEEKQNRSMGILLVYPEFYLKKNQNGYKYKEVLALTDTMKESFLHYAAFVRREQEEETYRMPISETVLGQIKSGRKKVVYMENTYRLGYECMQMIETYGKKKKMESIFLQPLKLDREILEAGSLDALLAR